MNAAYKNHSGFLRIAARVHREWPNVEFLLAGDGPLKGELEREAERLGVGRAVKFLGDQRSAPAVNASLDVAVLTSSSESLSNVILEAMAAGVPVVAYRCGGNPELVNEERGALIGLGDEGGFAEAILRLLRQPSLRERAGRNARRFVSARFSLESVVGRYEELYANLTSEAGTSPPWLQG
jgi:glycosyltransferase involved in cell wall biosynthesis